jgi:hypothetical protein
MNIDFISQVAASDLIGWLLAFLGGFIAYRIVDNMQTSLERHSVISDIEEKINHLFSSPIAKSTCSKDLGLHYVTVRTVLHDFSPWKDYTGDSEILMDDCQRYINIRDDDHYREYISSQALHEILILFRRIEKLHKSKIIKDVDLSDLWREILPLCMSNRLGFLRSYYSDRDIESILYVFMYTGIACHKYQMDNALDYIKMHYKAVDEKLKDLFQNNRRLRFQDLNALKKYKKIVNQLIVDEVL